VKKIIVSFPRQTLIFRNPENGLRQKNRPTENEQSFFENYSSRLSPNNGSTSSTSRISY